MEGVICGIGKISGNNGRVIYEGEFKDGMKNGVGYFCNWS